MIAKFTCIDGKRDDLYAATRGGPATLNGEPVRASTKEQLSDYVVSLAVIGRGVVHLYRLLSRALSPQFAVAATAGAVLLISAFLVNDVVADGFRDWANDSFGAVDKGTALRDVAPFYQFGDFDRHRA